LCYQKEQTPLKQTPLEIERDLGREILQQAELTPVGSSQLETYVTISSNFGLERIVSSLTRKQPS
jgi:hypothetical protein